MREALLSEEFVIAPPERRSSARRIIAIVAAVLVAGSGALFVLRSQTGGEPTLFRYAFSQGTHHAYDMTITSTLTSRDTPELDGFEMNMRATVEYSVLETAPDGSALIELGVRNVEVTPNPGSDPIDAGAVRLRVGSDGRILEVEGFGGPLAAAGAGLESLFPAGANPSDAAGSQFLFPTYAAEGVKVGETWSETNAFPLPFGAGDLTLTSKGRHDGFEESAYGRVARIHQSMTSPLDASFTMADVAAALHEELPAELRNARVNIRGSIQMDSDSLVIPETSDLVQMDGVMKTAMSMSMQDMPPSGSPSSFAFEMTQRISVVRVSGNR